MFWTRIWPWLRTWQGAVPAAVAVVAAIYYGPRKMLETWDWYWDRFRDNEVFFLIERRKIIQPPLTNLPISPSWNRQKELAYTVHEIAEYLGRKQTSVLRSVKRLQRRGKIERYQDGWRLKG